MGRARLIGQMALALGTAASAWAVLATTMGSVFARTQPRIAVRWSPGNAEANGNLAAQIYRDNPLNPDWSAILPMARRSLSRSPANVNAVATLGLGADTRGRKSNAMRLFAQSDRMSRHDPITQIYLIEAAVERGDIGTALRHYNAVLSTSRSSADLLEPVLISAAADPAIARPLGRVLARRPVWWTDFIRRLVQSKVEPGEGFPILFAALRLDPKDPVEGGLLSLAITRLVAAGRALTGYVLYRQAMPSAPTTPLTVRDGGFDEQPRVGLQPFDWEIHDGNGVSGSIQPRGAGKALFASTDTGINSEVAGQTLLLTPGRYTLTAAIGNEDQAGGSVAVTVACTKAVDRPLGSVRVTAGTRPGLWRTEFVVDRSCTSQRLRVLVSAGEQSTTQPWIDTIGITPAR